MLIILIALKHIVLIIIEVAKLGTGLTIKLCTNLKIKLGTNLKIKLRTNLKIKLGTNLKIKLGTNLKMKLGTNLEKVPLFHLDELSRNNLIFPDSFCTLPIRV